MSKLKLKNRIMIEKLKEFNYPDWARYVAVDYNGKVYAYSKKPVKCDCVWSRGSVCCDIEFMGVLDDFDDSVVIKIEQVALKPAIESINELIGASEKPVWARYVAVDNGGDVYLYSDKPKFVGGMWRTTSPECDIVYVGDIDFPENNAPEHCYETEYDWKADLEKSYNVPKSVIDRIAALAKGYSIHNVFVVIKSVEDALAMHGLADDEEIVKSFNYGVPLVQSKYGWIGSTVESVKGMNEISVKELKEVLNAE